MRRFLVVLLGFAFPCLAWASLVYNSSILLPAQGFGNAPRDLTVQRTGPGVPNDFESGCVGVAAGGGIIIGPSACRTTDAAISPNGVIPVGGDEPAPLDDNQKYDIPTLASLGLTNANQIAILFNATEPGGDSINVSDITLNFFGANGTFITSVDGQQNFLSTNPGNGVAGFVFVLDLVQQAIINTQIFIQPNFGSTVLALNASLLNATGGPDTFLIVNLAGGGGPGVTVPEPYTLALVGAALVGMIIIRRSKERAEAGLARRKLK